MKTTKKMLAMLLALCLLLGSVGALAEELTVTVTSDEMKGDASQGIVIEPFNDEEVKVMVEGTNVVPEGTDASKLTSLTVEAEGISEKVSEGESATGLKLDGIDSDKKVSIEVGTGSGNAIDVEGSGDAMGFRAEGVGGTFDIDVNGNIQVKQSGTDEEYPSAYGIRAGYVYSESTIDVDGNVTVISDGFAEAMDVPVNQKDVRINVTGDVTAEGKAAEGVYYSSSGSMTDVVIGGALNVNATDGDAMGMFVSPPEEDDEDENEDEKSKPAKAYGVTVQNGVVVESKGGDATGIKTNGYSGSAFVDVDEGVVVTSADADAVGIANENLGSTINISIDGNLTVTGKDKAIAINTDTNDDAVTTITVTGDVQANGKEGIGLLTNNRTGGQTDVLVDGTLSGTEDAVQVEKTYTEIHPERDDWTMNTDDVASTGIYVWAIKPNEEGRVATAVDSTTTYVLNPEYDADKDEYNVGEYEDENGEWINKYIEGETVKVVNKEETEKLEKSIQYIVKVQDAFANVLTAKGTGTYEANGNTYELAHQDENVTLNFTVAEGEVLEGIQYNEEKAAEYTKNEDGSYTVKMLRGGAMKLGLNLHKHTPAAAVNENVVAPTCTKDGSHDEVVYCSECKAELSRKAVTDKATGHKAGEAVIEKAVAPTCTKDGGHDEVVYCSVCKEELSRKAVTDAAIGHKAGEAVKENEVAPTCAKEGSYDEVVYCTVCKEELSRTKKTVEKLAHTPAAAARENEVAATTSAKGSYDLVIYCTVCNEELSREKVETPKLKKQDEDEAEPMPALVTELVYEPVSEDTEVNGVKASDALPMAEALETVGEALEGDDVSVTIPGVEKVLNAEEMARFDKLPVKERLLVTLSALGFADAVEADSEGLSDEGKALAEDVTARIESLSEADKQALLDTIAAQFPKGTVTVDGKSCESFSIDVVTERNGEKSYNRYTFYNDGGKWVLYGVEVGQYREAEA